MMHNLILQIYAPGISFLWMHDISQFIRLK